MLVVGSGQRHVKGQFLLFPERGASKAYHPLCVTLSKTENYQFPHEIRLIGHCVYAIVTLIPFISRS